MSIAILLQQILIIFLEIGTGAVVTKLGILDDSNSKFLSNLVMTVSLPCTLLASASIDGGRAAVVGMLKGYVVLEIFYLVTTAVCLGLSKALGLTPGQKAVLIGTAVLPNSAFIGMIGGIAAGLAYTLLRKATGNGVPKAFIIFFFSTFSCLASVPYCIANYTPMSLVQLGFLLLTGLAATGGQFSITAAYSFAPARELSVFDYTQVIFAGIMGFFFLNEVPDLLSVLGYITIIAAAVFMFLKGKQQPAES